jgi:hypothetical protein
MRDDDILIHRRPSQDPRLPRREPRSVTRDDDMIFRRRPLSPSQESEEREPHR